MYSPELQTAIDAANAKSRTGIRKQFAKKATADQRLTALLASCSAVLDAYYGPVANPEYARTVSLAIRSLRSTVLDVRSGTSSAVRSVASGRA